MAERISALERVSGSAFRFRNRLDSRFYVLRFLFNTRFQYWTYEIRTTGGVVIRGGIKVVTGEDLHGRFSEPELPSGTMVVIDSEGLDLDAGRFDLGDRVRLVHTSGAEITAA